MGWQAQSGDCDDAWIIAHLGSPGTLYSSYECGKVCVQRLPTCKLPQFSANCYIRSNKRKFNFKAYKIITVISF